MKRCTIIFLALFVSLFLQQLEALHREYEFWGQAHCCKHLTPCPKECLECVVPELKELSLSWGTLNDHSKEDFKAVLILLEKRGIASHQYSKKTLRVAEGVIRREHEKIILNQNVKVIFNEYTNTGEIYLNDAWVVTK
jgi:hypothetical protein